MDYAFTMTYQKVHAHYRKLGHLNHVAAIVGWDEAVMMPEGGGDKRGEALATLRVMMHDLGTNPALGEWLSTAAEEARAGKLDAWQSANVREAQRQWQRETAVPSDLVEAASVADSKSEQAWRKLRAQNDWKTYRPLLEEVVSLKRQVAQAIGAKLGLGPYDAMVDGYETGMRSADIDRVFGELKAFLPDYIARASEKTKAQSARKPVPPFPVEAQRKLGLELMAATGFDMKHGRLDVSHHPFCGGVPSDVRITTRYDERDFQSAMMGVLHETGHAKYEQGLPSAWIEQPVGQARSMAVHESQSLLQEMQVCRSLEFFEFAEPLIRRAFPASVQEDAGAFSAANLFALMTRVQPGFIRVDADEVTYPGHVILRYELEKALMEGTLSVADLPEAWDARMQAWFGLSTKDNYKDGCMQDVHWPSGAFGYFPSYTLGALLAAQLFAAAAREMPTLRRDIAQGSLTALNAWLGARVWSKASSVGTDALVREATGEPLSAKYFRAHLDARYFAPV
jgi:carboxypeptidase Taq